MKKKVQIKMYVYIQQHEQPFQLFSPFWKTYAHSVSLNVTLFIWFALLPPPQAFSFLSKSCRC